MVKSEKKKKGKMNYFFPLCMFIASQRGGRQSVLPMMIMIMMIMLFGDLCHGLNTVENCLDPILLAGGRRNKARKVDRQGPKKKLDLNGPQLDR